jgi:hypothetical protein
MDAERATQREIPTPYCDELPRLDYRCYIWRLNPHEMYARHHLHIRSYKTQGLFHAKTQTKAKLKYQKSK